MSRYIDAEAIDRAFSKLRFNNDGELKHYGDRPNWYLWGSEVENLIADAPSIDLDDYVPKEFHDKTCEAMAKAHQEEIADMVSVVRCKECAKWLGSSGICMWDKGTSLFTKADDYCSYGVRETNTTAEEKPTPIRDYMVHGEREGE